MQRVIKYALEVGYNQINHTNQLTPVHFELQDNTPTVWCVEQLESPATKVLQLWVAATGQELASDWNYVDTAMNYSRDFVLHLFQLNV